MPRLFIGTYLDKESQISLGALPLLNEHLAQLWQTRVRWLRESKLHLTWLYFGNVEREKIPELSQSISSIVERRRVEQKHVATQALTYNCLDLWYSQGQPRHLVLTPDEAPLDLLDFVEVTRNQLSIFAAEDVRQQAMITWKPHITLLRISESKEIINLPRAQKIQSSQKHRNSEGKELAAKAINGLSEILPLHHPLKTVSLIESKDEDGNHNYTALQTYLLV